MRRTVYTVKYWQGAEPTQWQEFSDELVARTFADRREIEGHHTRISRVTVVQCDCGREIECRGDTQCECGVEYNTFGQRLAPRSMWGEETGEQF